MPPPSSKSSDPSRATARRLLYHRDLKAWGLAGGVIAFSLALGMLGYHFIARFNWIDALLNTAMILTGMGPVGELHSTAAKVFASGYALFSGVVFLSASSIILAPVFHHVLYRFHIEKREGG